jgi:hypothetical protein
MPFCKKRGLELIAIILQLLYVIAAFYVLQLALFNVILLVLLFKFFFKVHYVLQETIVKKEYKY